MNLFRKYFKANNLFFFLTLLFIHSCQQRKVKHQNAFIKFNFHLLPEVYEKSIPDSLKYLIPIFDTILCDDQKFRQVNNPKLLDDNLKEQSVLDSLCFAKIEAIINKYGWLSYKQSGFKGNLALTSTLQHAPLKKQEYYLPILKKAFQQNKLSGDFLCMYEDRINSKNKKYQYYGTQVIYYKNKPTLYPVANIDSVNIWRKRMGGLSTVEAYLKTFFKTDFDPKEYKKLLPTLIKLREVRDSI